MPRPSRSGFTLVEMMLAIVITSICMLAIINLLFVSQRSLTQSLANIEAQASAEDLMQNIRLVKWDNNSVPGQRMSLTMAPLPTVTNPGTHSPPEAMEDWNGYSDQDTGRPYGPFARSVLVQFTTPTVTAGMTKLAISIAATDRKKVTVRAVGHASSATFTSVFYNLP